MTKSTEIVVMEEHGKEQAPKNNLFSLFPNINFDLQLPFFNPKPKDKPLVVDADQKKQEQEAPKPTVVRFPKTQVVVPPPLEAQAEAQGSTNKTSNPVILWQGFRHLMLYIAMVLNCGRIFAVSVVFVTKSRPELWPNQLRFPAISVYALGAFFISRWIWARWNERKAEGRPPNDGERGEGRHPDDGRPSSDNE